MMTSLQTAFCSFWLDLTLYSQSLSGPLIVWRLSRKCRRNYWRRSRKQWQPVGASWLMMRFTRWSFSTCSLMNRLDSTHPPLERNGSVPKTTESREQTKWLKRAFSSQCQLLAFTEIPSILKILRPSTRNDSSQRGRVKGIPMPFNLSAMDLETVLECVSHWQKWNQQFVIWSATST